jgi:putative addiction module component (TIGR02574 family)
VGISGVDERVEVTAVGVTANLGELRMGARMNSKEASVFDLSPSEELQLVEDLRDDLAATPEAVPVHDWQKRERERRKANLLRSPASASTWEDVMRRVRGRRDGG